ncbi:DNA-processing protein DprA [Cryobacterium tepidiphilum]|nr:DNA-processing protein DprA [Cryobacterium tepidiphilum]
MTFGMEAALLRELAQGVRAGDADDAGAAEVFARSAWSLVSEPGDGMAGLLVGCLGAVPALEAVIARRPADMLAREILSVAGDVALPEPADLEEQVRHALERWRPRLASAEVVTALRQARRVTARLLIPGDPEWPEGVDDLGPHAPLALWCRGEDRALAALGRSIALVGARAASGYGEHLAMEASAGLVDRGFAIVSGAAYGIDGMAHRAALASRGSTVAFLAGGVDRFYPAAHDALLTRIVESGAVLSELPCGAAPTKWRFLQRNRLIAAASQATVVLEAGWRSGSLNTAGHAAALGRPLGAVPGPVTSPTSAGCHRLIREYQAECVTNAAEMAELVGPVMDAGAGQPTLFDASGPTSDQVRVLDALSTRSSRSIKDIAARSGMSPFAVRGALGALELEGTVAERATGWVRASRTSR